MTPQLRRLTTAVAGLLVLAGLLSFGVGRVTRASEHEASASRSARELAAFEEANREAYAGAKVRGYEAGTVRGSTTGRRAGKARGRAKRARAQALAEAEVQAEAGVQAAAQAPPPADPPCSAAGESEAGGCGWPSQESSERQDARPQSTDARSSSSSSSRAESGAARDTSAGAPPRERRSVRVRKRWTTSQAGTRRTTTRRSRTTRFSGGTRTTRVRTSRRVRWSRP